MSEYYIATDIAADYDGMVIAIEDTDWKLFREVNREQLIVILIYLAEKVNLKKFKKSKRGKKIIKPKNKCDKKIPHVSTFKILLNSG